ncbi:glycoside hydrolase family 16 protein [Rothia nasimurium]|uniref:glycoside hydrolase family 16 protein n=1 Tax=Rothia nasimurium TaxID=85336 RepID=UPI001F48963D|nr:glycoside hydrolase family 16 protein [Rothia nasimurium]
MISVSRRNFLSLTAATAVAVALTTQSAQAATVATPLNGANLKSGTMRVVPLADVNYTSPFAQAFTNAATFTAAGLKASDALVEATFTTSRPATGAIYTRVHARRTTDGRNNYAALIELNNAGRLRLIIERTMAGRTTVLAQKILAAKAPAGTFSFDLALSVRATRLVAQAIVNGVAENLIFDDNNVPFTSTPAGVGTAASVYAGKTAPATHAIELTAAKADNWGEHRGSLTAAGWGKMIFEDDFNNGAIDGTKWNVRDKKYLNYDSGVNLKEAVTMGDSSAKIWLKKLATPVTYKDGKLREWGTGYIDTMGKFSSEYFRLEYRAKQPASTVEHIGAWGGIWMRPDKTSLLGEIDISESYGYTSGKQKVDISNRSEGTVHYGQQQGNTAKKSAMIPVLGQNLADEYHTWAIEKTPAGIKFFFDGVEYLFVSSEDPRYQAALPKGEKFNIRLCMQAGNAYWGGLASTTADCAVEVDYVRVWEYTGK